MKYQNKILSVLKEAIDTSSAVQDITTATQNAENEFKGKGFGDKAAEVLAIDAVTQSVAAGEAMEEGFSNANQVVKYDSERSGEDPFMMNGVKWQFVNVINDKGIKDIGVYRFDHDLAYDYMWFMNEVVPKPKSSDIVTEVEGEEDEYDRTDRADEGMDNLEVPDDIEANEKEYEEMQQLKQQAAEEEAEEEAKRRNESVVCKIKKGELERVMESLKPKKKIIKVKELKKSK